jgi:hypothetical protein
MPEEERVTIDDIIKQDNIAHVIEYLAKVKAHTEEAMAIWVTDDGHIHWAASGISTSRVMYLLEKVKFSMLADELAEDHIPPGSNGT